MDGKPPVRVYVLAENFPVRLIYFHAYVLPYNEKAEGRKRKRVRVLQRFFGGGGKIRIASAEQMPPSPSLLGLLF